MVVAVTKCQKLSGDACRSPLPGPSIAAGCVQLPDFPTSLDSLTCVKAGLQSLTPPTKWRCLPVTNFLIPNSHWLSWGPCQWDGHIGAIMTNSWWGAGRDGACHSNCAWYKRQHYPLFDIVSVHREDSALTLYNYSAIISKLACVSKSLTQSKWTIILHLVGHHFGFQNRK